MVRRPSGRIWSVSTGTSPGSWDSISPRARQRPRDPARRTSLVVFNLAGRDPVSVAEALNRAGVESRAGCHCATLAHHALKQIPRRAAA